MKKVLYMKTENNELELPIAVAESPGELAKMLKTTKATVLSGLGHKYRGWHKIVIDDEEEER